jgi:hypothetical protein
MGATVYFRAASMLVLAALVLQPTRALADGTADPDPFAIKAAPQNSAAVKAGAEPRDLDPQLQMDLRLALEANPSAAGADPFAPAAQTWLSRESLGLNAAWAPVDQARVELAVGDNFGQTWNHLSPIVVSGRQGIIDDRTASVGVILKPSAAVDVSLVGSAAQDSVLDTIVDEANAPRTPSLFNTATQAATAALQWRPVSWFTLDAKSRLETSDVQWRGAPSSGGGEWAQAGLSYAYLEPSVVGSATTPWNGKLGLAFERAVSPVDARTFATFASVANRADGATFGPNREWRLRLDLDQTLAGDLRLHAALTQARIESATELGPVGAGLQAPVSVPGGERQELDVQLSAPLADLGLPSVSLRGSGVWRTSQVRDPFTEELRRASGEVPRSADLGLVQVLADRQARWGIVGRFGGDQNIYQMSEVTRETVADSVGGFVEYVPGPFSLRLQVDGLYGGDRVYADSYYIGSRGLGYVSRTDRRAEDGQALRLILRKTL